LQLLYNKNVCVKNVQGNIPTHAYKKEKRNKQIPKQSYEEEKNSNTHLHSKLYMPKESFKKQSKLINLAKCFLKKKTTQPVFLFSISNLHVPRLYV